MAGQIWATSSEGGFLYSDEMSDVLRMQLQPLTKFRPLCDARDAAEKGLHAGDSYVWNVYSNVSTQGQRLSENAPIPETGFTITQNSVSLVEFGNSVPYTGRLEALGKHDVVEIIDKALANDARKAFDVEAFLQFKNTPLRVAPTSGTSETAVTLTTNSATATTNNVDMGNGHIKAIVDVMKERDIPAFKGDDYACISHPTTFRPFRNDLESTHQYTDTGIGLIYNGEVGRYEGVRFIEQNHIPKGGANDSTTFDAWTNTADAWNNAKSSWAFFFGADTVTEAIAVPEEIRAKIPGDYGRSKGVAWYSICGFGIVHSAAADARIVMWDSAA